MNSLTRFIKDHCTITEQGCWEWNGTRRKGYGRITIDGTNLSVHRLVFSDSVAEITRGNVVMHAVCDNPPCCNPEHLKQGTQAENLEDMRMKGRAVYPPGPPQIERPQLTKPARPKGGSHANAKMTDSVVQDIRYLYDQGGLTQRELAEKYGVSQSNISRALSGKQWAHV